MSSGVRDDLSSLRDDLASLKIDRPRRVQVTRAAPAPTGDTPSFDPRPRRRRRSFGLALLSLLFWLVPLGLLAAGGYFGYQQYLKIKPRREVAIAVVQRMTTGEAGKVLTASGFVHARSQAMVGARMPGRVQSVSVEEGDKVKAGQVLAVLEHNDLDAQLASRLAMVERTKAELIEAEASQSDRRRREARAKRLHAARGLSIEDLDDAVTQRQMADARVSALRAGISLMQANAKEVEETIRNMHIVAPFAGTVLSKDAELGETITPGGMGAASGRGSVVVLADLDHLEVETNVTELMIARVELGQAAEIAVTAVPDRRYRGKVHQIIPMGDRGKHTIKVNVEILDPDEKLFPDLEATVHFLSKTSARDEPGAPQVFVPKSAIIEEGGHSYVWVVDASNTLVRTDVEVVMTDNELARVESGLSGGERVATKPDTSYKQGEPVKAPD